MQRKKIIWILLVGCTAVAIFYPSVFEYGKYADSHVQLATLSAQTGVSHSLGSLQAQELEYTSGAQLSARAPQSPVMNPPQNKSESQQFPEPSRQSFSSQGGSSDVATAALSISSNMTLTDNQVAQSAKSQQDSKQRFIKMDASGRQLSDDADTWACVYDSKTRLLWENKIGMSHELRYRWSEPSVKKESPEHCPYFAGNQEDKIENCTTSLRVGVANSTQLCGSSAWQVPNIAEFETIIMSGQYNPSINTRYFPYTQSDYYWTREGFAYSELNAWAINFAVGKVNDVAKVEFMFVRLVSSGETNNDL